MKWDDIGNLNCSIARSLALIGDRWTLLLLRNAFMGTRRFDDFQAQLGITRQVLAERLKRLVDVGILCKQAYQPHRYEYRLTEKGLALYPVLMSLAAWGDTWLGQGAGPPLLFRHLDCGQITQPRLTCSECGASLNPHRVMPVPGPSDEQPGQAHTTKQ